jgi:uncharacterized damage-inducible protein DinB
MNAPAIASQRPRPEEHNPYYSRYISLVPEADIVATLRRQADETRSLLRKLTEDQGNYRYAPDKWSVKEMLGHLSDTERVFAYRALSIARNDKTPLPGFEQDDYVRFGPFAQRSLAEVAEDIAAVRQSSLSLLGQLDETAWGRSGTANNSPASVRAIAFIMAGHELHHRNVLKEKYKIG